MDKTILLLQEALVGTRADIARDFQGMITQVDRQDFADFLIAFALHSATLSQWLCDWNQQMSLMLGKREQKDLALQLELIADGFNRRYQCQKIDQEKIVAWLDANVERHLQVEQVLNMISVGMKQLRTVFQDCMRRHKVKTWLCVLMEIERLRIVHGFSFIKLCDTFFGSGLLRCFSVIFDERRRSHYVFGLCETLLQQESIVDEIIDINAVKTASKAYSTYVNDCYKLSKKRVANVF
jgi:hypothetical protein